MFFILSRCPPYLWTKSKVLWCCIHSFTYLGLIVYYLYCQSLSYVLNAMYIVLYLHSLEKGTEHTIYSALEWVAGC